MMIAPKMKKMMSNEHDNHSMKWLTDVVPELEDQLSLLDTMIRVYVDSPVELALYNKDRDAVINKLMNMHLLGS